MSRRTMIIDDIENLPFQVGLKLRDLLLQLFNFPSNSFLLVKDGLPDVLPEHVHIVPETREARGVLLAIGLERFEAL